MSFRIGVDIGGTFTDFALIDDATGAMSIHKQLTTPKDPSRAVLEGIDTLLAARGVPMSSVSTVIHGSTLVTNALIERRGARIGMLVTEGFRDVLDVARETRYDLYDLRIRIPEPLVPRAMRAEVGERIGYDGKVQQAPDMDAVARFADAWVDAGVEAIAVCLLHSFTNPVHEDAIAALLRRRHPSLYVSASADVFPFMREYERWTTTTMNAYVQPVVDRYLGGIETGLQGRGFAGSFHIMTSSGGTVAAETARRYPVRMLESGPAAGVLMSSFVGRRSGIDRLLAFDMGGTTAKGAIVRDNVPLKKYEIEVARIHEFRDGSGLPAKIPVIDMIEIGAGGGSIAQVDERSVIQVGPRSAGADPGPACYGLGGTSPTLSDANLLLGYYDPRYFLGGKMALNVEAAERAIGDAIAAPLRLDTVRAAWGIHEVINEDVARAFRVHASEVGFDYRSASMVAFGGSGPAHAMRIARKLRIPQVVFPLGSGVMSAFGMLVSPLSFETARTQRVAYDALTQERFVSILQELTREAAAPLERAGVRKSQITTTYRLDMRYVGQGYEIEVALPADVALAAGHRGLPEQFAKSYAEVFSISYLKLPLEIMNWKVEARGPTPQMAARTHLVGVTPRSEARKGTRRAYFPDAGGFIECPVWDRYALSTGDTVEGPAFVEERESTVVLSPGDVGTIDELGNLIARVGQATESDAAPGAKEADAMKRAAMSGAAQTTGAAYKSNAATKTNAATQTKAATKTTTAANSNAAADTK